MRHLLGRGPTGPHLYLLAAFAAVFLLVPAAQALAAPEAHIEIEGSGSGAVLGSGPTGGGIECHKPSEVGDVCDAEMTENSGTFYVKVKREVAGGSEFAGWEVPVGNPLLGCGAASAECTVTSTGADVTIKAFFNGPPEFPLEVEVEGEGEVNAAEPPTPLSGEIAGCEESTGECLAEYNGGDAVELTATEETGWEFSGWTTVEGNPGTCEGATSPCTVTVSEATKLKAVFVEEPNVHILISGEGSGNVLGVSPLEGAPPIDCEWNGETEVKSGVCDTVAKVVFGTAGQKVKYEAALGSKFGGWHVLEGTVSSCEEFAETCAAAFPPITIEASFDLIPLFALNLTTSGTGGGSFECDSGSGAEACQPEYLEGTEVEVIPAANPDSNFVEWTGDCSGEGVCEVTMDEEHSVGGVFDEKPPFALNLTTSGTGGGSFECDSGSGAEACQPEYLEGTEVEVIPAADAGSEFVEWTGDCSGTDPEGCTPTMDEEHSVGAVFDLIPTFALNLSTSGTGSGSFECDSGSGAGPCAAEYLDGTVVEVIPVADAGSEFVEWTGDCSGEGACEVTMDEEHSVGGVFDLIQRALTINQSGTGSGVVECEVEESEIEEACQATYPDGTAVIVIAYEEPGSEFVEWTGGSGCEGGPVFENECEVTMDADKTVGVVFDLITHALTVNTAGSGSGSVSCDGGPCAGSYPEGTTVTLTASAASGSTFAGWSGAGCAGTGSCVVTIDADTTVTATFNAESSGGGGGGGGDNGGGGGGEETCLTNAALCKPGLLIANPAALVKGNKALLKVRCRGEQGARCRSTLKLTARIRVHGKKKNVLIGKSKYNLPTNSAVRVLRAKLTSRGIKLVRRAGKGGLKVKLAGKGAKIRVVKLVRQGGGGRKHKRHAGH